MCAAMAACPKDYGCILLGDRVTPFTNHMNSELHSQRGIARTGCGVLLGIKECLDIMD